MLKRVADFDLERALAAAPLFGERRTRTLFAWLVALNAGAFFFFIAHHLLHNHAPRLPWMAPEDQLFAGRWFNAVMGKLLYGADIPVFGALFSIIIGVTGGLFLLRLWRLPATAPAEFLVVGILTTYPATLAYFYYSYQTPLFFAASFFAVAAAAAAGFRPGRFALSALCVTLMLASYQPALSILATVIVSCAIAAMIRRAPEGGAGAGDYDRARLREAAVAASARVAALGAGGLVYMASLPLFGASGGLATETAGFSALPDRAILAARAAFAHLVTAQPDLPATMKGALLVLLACAVAASLWLARRSAPRLAALVVLWPALILATKAMYLVSPVEHYYFYRYNGALGALHAFCAMVTLYAAREAAWSVWRSGALVLAAFIVLRFVQADLVRQEVLYRGERHDLAIANRVLARMESLPGLDLSQTYDLVRVGRYSSYRAELLASGWRAYGRTGEEHMDWGEISAPWSDEAVFRMLGTRINFEIEISDPDFSAKQQRARAAIGDDRKPWPHASSVFIEGDMIVVYMGDEG